MFSTPMDLWGLFIASFISSTLFPGGSEVILGLLNSQNTYSQWQLWSIATLGNTMGAMTTWLIGWVIAIRYPADRLEKPSSQRAVQYLKKWGSPVLLLSWLPVIGDPLCLAAGWLRINFLVCLSLIALGKAARYYMVIWISA